jgi:hypothetical protein
MRRGLCRSMAAGAIGALLLALGGAAQAMTCSERLQVCHGYCAKSMGDSPACHSKCRQFQQECWRAAAGKARSSPSNVDLHGNRDDR